MYKFSLLIVCLFLASSVGAQSDILLLKQNGKVVIGDISQITTPGNYQLYVQNGILTEKVKVAVKSSIDWADDAWEDVPTMDEVECTIQEKKHLPAMPSAATLVEQGYDLQSMDAKLLAQIEWIWLHMIELKKENASLKAELDKLKE